MYELLPKIIDSLNSHQLEEIFIENKLIFKDLELRGLAAQLKHLE